MSIQYVEQTTDLIRRVEGQEGFRQDRQVMKQLGWDRR
jgi:hypothetical protein